MALVGGEKLTPKSDQDPSKTKKAIAAGSAAVALVAGGIGIGIASSGNQEGTPNSEHTAAATGADPEAGVESPNAIDEALNPDNIPGESSSQETENNLENTSPILMTAETPEGLLDQYRHNAMCMTNNVDYDAQIKCAEYIYGQSVETGDWSSILQTLEEQNDYTEIARRADPNYQTNFTYELLDSETTNSSITMTVLETKELYGEDHTVEGYFRLTFNKKIVSIEDLSASGGGQEAWVKVSGKEIQPGSVS